MRSMFNPNIDPERLQEYLNFCKLRHAIYIKRFVHELPSPWTDDEILQKYRFCNVYRELDAGTAYYVEDIKNRRWPDSDAPLFRAIVNRVINNKDFFISIGGIPDFIHNFNWLIEKARIYAKKAPFVGRAYLSFACTKKGKTKVQSFAEFLWWLEDNFEEWDLNYFSQAKTLEEASHCLEMIPFIGKFIAYEILCDLMLVKYIKMDINSWANIGPGAKPSIDKIIIDRKEKGITYLEGAKQIMREFNSQWPYEPLNLRNIEHSLCEWRKYWKIAEGGYGKFFKPYAVCAQ